MRNTILNLNPTELDETYRSALESAALLRRCGETAKAVRLESMARIIARARQRPPSDSADGMRSHQSA